MPVQGHQGHPVGASGFAPDPLAVDPRPSSRHWCAGGCTRRWRRRDRARPRPTRFRSTGRRCRVVPDGSGASCSGDDWFIGSDLHALVPGRTIFTGWQDGRCWGERVILPQQHHSNWVSASCSVEAVAPPVTYGSLPMVNCLATAVNSTLPPSLVVSGDGHLVTDGQRLGHLHHHDVIRAGLQLTRLAGFDDKAILDGVRRP